MSTDKPRYQVTITARVWDSSNGSGIGFDESSPIGTKDFEQVLEMLIAFHQTALKFMPQKEAESQ